MRQVLILIVSPGSSTRNAARPTRKTHGARIRITGAYEPVIAAHFAKRSGPIADARTVSICAAPWIRPRWAAPNRRQIAKNITVIMPPDNPMSAAKIQSWASVMMNGSATRASP